MVNMDVMVCTLVCDPKGLSSILSVHPKYSLEIGETVSHKSLKLKSFGQHEYFQPI